VDRTGGGLDKGGFFVSEVVDLVDFLSLPSVPPIVSYLVLESNTLDSHCNVFCETAVGGNSETLEVLAQQVLSSAAVEAGVALGLSLSTHGIVS
jgi:hypothetical protein